MSIRRMPFKFSHIRNAHWHEHKPEFAQIVNGASLAMPFLEPYLIKTMRAAKPLITSPSLARELDLYITQEARHSGQHKLFNQSLAELGYKAIPEMEAKLAYDYEALGKNKSLRFNLAYAEGFESMALAIAHMLIEQREYLFKDSDGTVAGLVLWHFVEEIEHKNVAFDVFDHLYGGYFWRMVGLFYATGHIFWRTGQAYRALLKEDGLWTQVSSRWQLAKLLTRILGNLIPKWLRIMKPGYHPSKIQDPDWAARWAELFQQDPDGAAQLDTHQIQYPSPIPLAQPH